MKVVILDDYTDTIRTIPAFAGLAGHEVSVLTTPVEGLEAQVARLEDADALILIRERTQIREDILVRLPKLRMISHVGNRGYSPNVDVDACTRLGILFCDGHASPLVRVPQDGIGRARAVSSTAELTWALIMAATRHLPQQVAALKAGVWQLKVGRSLWGRTLGIYGYGTTGRKVAAYGRAFGMDVQVWGREGSQRKAAADGYRIAADKAALFAMSDILSLHVLLTPETEGLVTSEDFARMKPDSLFVNTSRAPLVAPGALVAALEAGRPAAAAVDVYEREPLIGGNHPLLSMDNVICTPHIGYSTQEQLEVIFEVVIEQFIAFSEGRPHSVVNGSVQTCR